MKTRFDRFVCLILCLLMVSGVLAITRAEEGSSESYILTASVTEGEGTSYVSFPVLTGGDENICSAVNGTLSSQAFQSQYLNLLSGLSSASVGIRVSFESNVTMEQPFSSRYLSICIIADGKQPQGRPGLCRYAFTFDLVTGETIPFEALCLDPDAAMEAIECYIVDEVSEEISDYMEFAALSPVPFDRYYCDGLGNITFCYDRMEFAFLSGAAGAVTIPQSVFSETLDLSENSVLAGLLNPDKTPLGIALIGEPLLETLEVYESTLDSSYYYLGEAYTLEEPCMRGTYLLTDTDGEWVRGVLFTSLIPSSLIRTADDMNGMTMCEIDERTAEQQIVCSGTAYIAQENGYEYTYYFDTDQNLYAVRVWNAQ